jgi:hypothetical protein
VTLAEDEKPRTSRQIEEHFGFRRGMLRAWRWRGVGPPVFARPTPRGYMYRIRDVAAWLVTSGRAPVDITVSSTLTSEEQGR